MPKPMIPLPSKEQLQEFFRYDDSLGALVWRERRNSLIRTDGPAGSLNSRGYRQVCIGSTTYKHHRLVWAYFNGDPGPLEVDHINGIKGDDRIENLRLATHAQNQYNFGLRADNSTGYRGVRFHKSSQKYMAQIRISN